MVRNRLLDRILKKIENGYNPEKMIVFGSYAWGEPEKDSDLDLFIIKNTSKKHRERAREVRHLLREENQEIGLDILVYTPREISDRLKAGDKFIEQVVNKGEVVYG